MANHPNRGNKTAASNPTPEDVIRLRESYGLTQAEVAKKWLTTLANVQKWEAPAGSENHRRVHPLMWYGMQRILEDQK